MGRLIVARVRIGGHFPNTETHFERPVRMILDTGASQTLVEYEFATYHLKPYIAPNTDSAVIQAMTVQGQVQAYTFECEALEWEGLVKENFVVSAIPALSANLRSLNVSGLLGTDVLFNPTNEDEAEELALCFPTQRIGKLWQMITEASP